MEKKSFQETKKSFPVRRMPPAGRDAAAGGLPPSTFGAVGVG
jgi:hypothetical protein